MYIVSVVTDYTGVVRGLQRVLSAKCQKPVFPEQFLIRLDISLLIHDVLDLMFPEIAATFVI